MKDTRLFIEGKPAIVFIHGLPQYFYGTIEEWKNYINSYEKDVTREVNSYIWNRG